MTIEALPALPRSERTGHTGDRVRHVLQEAILESLLPPGTHLNADSLAKRLGVSHIPVREALRSLAADGWIELRPHAGAFVRPRDEQELADLFEARQLLESRSAALAADRRTAAQLAALDAVLAEQAATSDPLTLARLDARFHVQVAECSQNALMTGFVRTLSLRARFYCSAVAPDRADPSLREHTALVDAIRRRDAPAATRIARAHVTSTGTHVLKALRG
ncbi:GntR family transcriptional regulator [Dactylosporangium sp. NPDC051541]|uniref:GntR family transcriptional regulator n=1 Tax=Dactylosporangium sp. NPDC051541 TaxID=3363977 RepID=UPI0037AFBC8D